MQLMMTPAEASLQDVVGTDTFLRGRDYARRGAVLSSQYREDRGQLFGQVRGTGRSPYTAMAVVGTSVDGTLTSFHGSCTCPVGTNCKHSVALVLATLTGAEADANVVTGSWERALVDLVTDDATASAEPQVALQFDLIAPPSGGGGRGVTAPRISVRPVVPGRNGGWVRMGISWSNLAYLSYSHPHIAPEHVRLLNDILLTDSSSYYRGSNQAIDLASLASRRIWDLLEEARAVGLPLVQTGRSAPAVTLYSDPAEVVVDVRGSDTGLALHAEVRMGAERPAPGATLLLGAPAHGVAWWPSTKERTSLPKDGLRLARLDRPVEPAVRQLLDRGTLVVPRRDEARFFSVYYPALRQRARLICGDESVVLPEPLPPTLHLVLRHLDGHRLSLEWHWRYCLAEESRRVPLWPSVRPERGRDPGREGAVLATVGVVVEPMSELSEPSPAGPRLTATCELAGISTIRFATELLPRLEALSELTIETHGTPTDYRSTSAEPVVTISGAESGADRDWFDLAVTVTVEGESVPFEQLFVALSSGQSHLILPSGTYFSLDRPEFRALAELIVEARGLSDRVVDGVRLSRYQVGLWDELDKLGVVTGQAAQWQRSVRALSRTDELVEPAVPPMLQAVLRPYQRDGFTWLAFLHAHRLGGILADDMGLGKTVQTLAMICHARKDDDAAAPFLVVAPTSVVGNWVAESARFAPGLDVRAITETRTRRGRDMASVAAGADIVVTSYTLFRLEYDDYAQLEWSGLILDEAQFVKNHQSRGHQCAKKLPAPFKLAITGTPMENNLMELWSLLSITAPGLFASPARFEQQYRTPIEKESDPAALDRLRRRVKPLMLRRSKEQVARDLPEKQEQVLELALNPRHRRIYQTHLQRERQKVLGLLGNLEKNRFEIFRSLTLLRQASLDVALIDPKHADVSSTKLDAMMELLTEIVREGHRTLVFSQFTRFLSAARRRLDDAGIPYVYLDGSTRNRPAVLNAFKRGTAPVFLISLKAGGVGLNLTEADYCILLDPWWNPATEAQAVDRVHRIGQRKKVMVYRLVAKDTIEEKVMALKAKKAALFGSVMDGGAFASGRLTATDIRGLLD